MATAAAVSVSGVVGWVGLVIPHIARMLVGPDTKFLFSNYFFGGTYLLLIDNLARSMATAEVPLGILTALIGAPFFAYLLRKGRMVMKLDVKGATFAYNTNNVFEGLDLSLGENEFFCILGPNGCGKTTFLKCLARMLELKEGMCV